jgi:hypothetical protein
MEKIFVKKNLILKIELDKEEFIRYFVTRLNNIDISNSLYDIILLLVQSAEEKFYKRNKKLGKTKKEAVIGVLKGVMKNAYDEKLTNGMIESILANQDIRRSNWFVRVWNYIKIWFQGANKE